MKGPDFHGFVMPLQIALSTIDACVSMFLIVTTAGKSLSNSTSAIAQLPDVQI